MASVKVAVRVRPFNQRELDMDAQLIIRMEDKKTSIVNSKASARDPSKNKDFTFDYSYWSFDQDSCNYASQETVYQDLGTEVINCAFQGYNACVFAYGQTGSGKTFTMMGSPDNQGLIPRICRTLFDKMSENSKKGITHRVNVSYLEIYQERVADLLGTRENSAVLKVREHPKTGPYVEGLKTCLVTDYNDIEECMNRGNSQRTTAATNMNDVSSRSHAIFTLTFVQAGYCGGVPSETVSKIHLVDLAGSERADATGATGQRLKEGAHINKSLVTLGSVISTLAEHSFDSNGQKKPVFIPYRDSVLTWLLKDSLGGNSKTIMIAAISPADCNYGETLSTLRYANRAKNIINKPTVNEDPNVKLIRELRDEISKLKALMFQEGRSDMMAQLHAKEAREKELTEEWTGKWREAQDILREQKALGLRKAGPGVVLDSDRPHLVAIDDDPLSTGVTLYHLKEGRTSIGTGEAEVKQDIELKGAGMEPEHCIVTFENGIATLHPQPGATVMLNNVLIDEPARLSQGCIIFLGKTHVFRFNDPAEAAQLRKGEKTHNLSRLSLLSWSTPDLAVSMESLQVDEEKSDIEAQRMHLEKEKEQFEKQQEAFEKRQEAFEKRRKSLEQAQAKLEAEKLVVKNEHAEQTRLLQEDWENITAQQRERELSLKRKEAEIIHKRNELEKERKQLMKEISGECENLHQLKGLVLSNFNKACGYVLSQVNEFTFPNSESRSIFQELVGSSENSALSENESNSLVDILNNVKGNASIQEVINQHRKELAELQVELNKRIQILSERQKSVEILDKKLVDLVDEQADLGLRSKDKSLESLKQVLAARTKEELDRIELKKQGLRLNLKKVNSVESADSCEVNCNTDTDRGTLSTESYHTAESACSPTGPKVECLMSDSGVELRPSLHLDDSDLSSNDDKVVSDSQSSSSVENHSPVKKKRSSEGLRNLAQRIAQQKQLIVKNLDNNFPNSQLEAQISNLQQLQKQYMCLKFGSSMLSPTTEHPLQDEDSPSPLKPLHTGSTSALYSPPLQPVNRLQLYGMYRSMPSITTETEEAVVSITSYCLRGAGAKTHYEYEVRICTEDDRWTILRRYSRFRDLHIAMKAKYKSTVASIPFPSKQLFSNTESVAQTRKRHLEVYLRRLIEACRNHPNCPLAYSGPVTKNALINFSPFFRKGVFENGKYGTS